MPSFTTQVPNLREAGPVVEVTIAVGSALEKVLRQGGQAIAAPVQARAMIDTGAARTVVRSDLIAPLQLHPVGSTLIHTASDENIRCPEYLLRPVFPSRVVAETVAVAARLPGQSIQCLVGRDVLERGVFIYTGYIGTFTLSF